MFVIIIFGGKMTNIGYTHCWACGTKITHTRGPDDFFFWCDEKCCNVYTANVEKQQKVTADWSSYMTSENSEPKSEKTERKIKPVKVSKVLALQEKKDKLTKKSVRIRKMGDSGHRTNICGKCGEGGHNSRTCEK